MVLAVVVEGDDDIDEGVGEGDRGADGDLDGDGDGDGDYYIMCWVFNIIHYVYADLLIG